MPGLEALARPEPLRARAARAAAGLMLGLVALALVFASGSFVWGATRTLHGDVLPKLAALLALVIAARVLRRSQPTPLLAAPDGGALWRERLGAFAEACLALAAVSAALNQVWVLVLRLASS